MRVHNACDTHKNKKHFVFEYKFWQIAAFEPFYFVQTCQFATQTGVNERITYVCLRAKDGGI